MDNKQNIHSYINHFWQMRQSTFFTSLEADLYYALLHEANTRRWKETFSISNGWLTAKIGTSEPSLIRARNKLKQCGLIDFVSGKTKRQPSKYRLICASNYLNNFSANVSSNVSENNGYLNNFSSGISQSVSSNVSPSVRQVKNKDKDIRYNTNKDFSKNNFLENFSENEIFENPMEIETSEIPVKTEISPSKKVAPKKVSQDSQVDELELPFESEEFRENWLGFRQARREMKKPITLTAAKMIFKKLERFGEQVASKALEDSATNNWLGVFPENIVRQQNQTKTQNTNQIIKPDFINADYSDTTL